MANIKLGEIIGTGLTVVIVVAVIYTILKEINFFKKGGSIF